MCTDERRIPCRDKQGLPGVHGGELTEMVQNASHRYIVVHLLSLDQADSMCHANSPVDLGIQGWAAPAPTAPGKVQEEVQYMSQ